MRIEPNIPIIKKLVCEKSFSLNSFHKKVPNQAVSKKLTYLDVLSFHNYIDSKRLSKNENIEEINKLKNLTGKDLINSVIGYFMKEYKYPKELQPKVKNNKAIDGSMGFSPLTNTIFVNPSNIEDNSFENIICITRHEFKHFENFVNMLRNSYINKKAVKLLSCASAAENKLNEQYKMHEQINPNEIFDAKNIFKGCIIYYDKHPEDMLYIKKYNELNNYRKIAIKKLGILPRRSEENYRTQKIFEEYKKKIILYTEKEINSVLDNHCTYDEYEAYLSGIIFKNQIFEKDRCLFNLLKERNKYFIDSYTNNNKLNRILSYKLKERVKYDSEYPISFLNDYKK